MPILTPCRAVGCPTLVTKGYCSRHTIEATAYDHARGTSASRGYDYQWRKFRAFYLAEAANAMCSVCGIRAAQEVHHKLPLADHPELKYNRTNLQPLCKPCHSRITAATVGHKPS